MEKILELIRKLVGDVSIEEIKNVDCFVNEKVGVFIPVVGPCYYAVKPNHTHPAYSFIHTFDDRCRVEMDSKIFQYKNGALMAFSPDIPHHEIIEDGFSRYIAIMIEKELFESQLNLYNIQKRIFKGDTFISSADIVNTSKKFIVEYENKLPGCDVILDTIGIQLCHSIIRTIFDFRSEFEKLELRLEIDEIIEFLHKNYAQKITVENMAKVINMSVSHFSRVFKNETGKSPIDYLINIRLDKAKKLLRAGDLNITEVALECGFNSSSHFSSCFVTKFNLSPSDFKRSLA